MVRGRVRELGIRIALGAPAGEVRKLVVRHGMSLAAGGIALGLAGALLCTRAMQGAAV